DPQGRAERRRPGGARADRAVRELEGGARGLRSRAPTRRGGPRGGRGVRRQGGSLRRGPDVREPPHHMTPKARQELVGIGALVVGLFLGLTLLRLPITGSWGERIGSLLWRVFGAGSVLLPVLGIGWALAAFERLGTLSAGRAAALGGGLVVLLPYGIGTVTGAGFGPDYRTWGPTAKLVGVLPAALARGVHQAVGTAGGVLVGLFALSAIGLLTVGWHPLVVLRTGKKPGEKAGAKAGEEGRGAAGQGPVPTPPSPQSTRPQPPPSIR